MNQAHQRLFFLDWVRIAAFMLLVAYHVGMYYVSWDWHVKSPFASAAIEPLMLLSSPWRLGLLFLIAGVASSCMAAKMSKWRFVGRRSVRLLVPLIFGMFVIVPPQAYFEVVEKVAYQGSYGEFMRLYVSAYPGFCRAAEGCLDMPTWNHLWFVAYLLFYTLLLGAMLMLLGPRFDDLARRVGAQLTGWKLIVLPAAVLAIIRLLLLQRFPSTHGLTDDWFNHASYMSLFMLGALLARCPQVWPRMEASRWYALGIALTCWCALVVYFSLPEAITLKPEPHGWRLLMRSAYALCAWCAMVAACGFAHRHLNFDSAGRRYLTEAVFPVYIVHQSLIVIMAHMMKPAAMAPATEALILIVLTLCLSFATFEIVRRITLLRPLFGLERLPKTAVQPAPQAAPVPI